MGLWQQQLSVADTNRAMQHGKNVRGSACTRGQDARVPCCLCTLSQEWEGIATELANAGSDAEVAQRIQGLLDGADHAGGTVLLGRDTRPSGPELLAAAKAGVEAAGGVVVDLGQVTTPQLHFMVVEYNTRPTPATRPQSPPSLDIYFSTLLDAFEQLVSSSSSGSSQPAAPYTLHVDCACGIGATHLQTAANKLAAGKSGLRFALLNTPGPPGSLNHCCGADYVQKEQVAPAAFQDLPTSARCASLHWLHTHTHTHMYAHH